MSDTDRRPGRQQGMCTTVVLARSQHAPASHRSRTSTRPRSGSEQACSCAPLVASQPAPVSPPTGAPDPSLSPLVEGLGCPQQSNASSRGVRVQLPVLQEGGHTLWQGKRLLAFCLGLLLQQTPSQDSASLQRVHTRLVRSTHVTPAMCTGDVYGPAAASTDSRFSLASLPRPC